MRVGDRVEVIALWSSFKGMRGKVKATTPHLMILFDGDTHPMRIEEPSVIEITDDVPMTGAE